MTFVPEVEKGTEYAKILTHISGMCIISILTHINEMYPMSCERMTMDGD